jgi:stage III sporulation protein AH
MKKGKVFSKGQAVAVLMIIALGGAVWVNMKFSSSEKYLGEAKYVSNNSSSAVQTSAKADSSETDYFKAAKKEREDAIKEAQDVIKETLDSDKLTDKDKEKIVSLSSSLASRIEQANNIETLLKAKGFNKAVAVIGTETVNIVVKSDGLTTAQTLQIQDIVTNESGISLENIKIVPVK